MSHEVVADHPDDEELADRSWKKISKGVEGSNNISMALRFYT